MNLPTVSVLIPSYNHEKYIEDTINSIINQTFQDFEIIITDDGSSDGTVEKIKGFNDERITLFSFKKNKGAPCALNNCINNSRGKFLAYVSSDDVWELNKLEKQVDFLDKNPDIGAVFTKVSVIDDEGNNFQNKDHFYSSIFDQKNRSKYQWLRKFFFEGNCICHPSIMIRKNIYDDIGLYDNSLANLPDFDFWTRLCLKYDIHILDEKLTKFRIRNDGLNASNSEIPENLIRTRFEFKQILNNFLIDDLKLFLKIFPESITYGEVKKELIPYFLGRLAYNQKEDFKKLWGLEQIFSIMESPELSRILIRDYDYDSLDFIKMSSGADCFNINRINVQNNELKIREENIRDKIKIISEKNNEISFKDNEISFKNETIKNFKKKEKDIIDIKKKLISSNHMLEEFKYMEGNNRPFFKKLVSHIPSLYIIYKNKFNIKKSFIDIKGYNKIKNNNGLFNIGYYLSKYENIKISGIDPILHYMFHGYKEGKIPNPGFDTKFYLSKYPDVKYSGLNPLIHYSLYGKQEKRKTMSIKSNKNKSKSLKNIKSKSPFNDFAGFLSSSILSPLIDAPFIEEEKRCFAIMENITKYLINNVTNSDKRPLVSIIMPVYNRINLVQNAISSVLEQTYENIELIIVDDGSDDGTSEFLDEIENNKISIIHNDSCKGVSTSRNIGVNNSNGEYIAYLDSDNDWDSRYIESMVGAFFELNDAELIYSGQLLFNKKNKRPFGIRFGSFNKSLLVNRNYIDMNCICHTKSSFDKINGFDENLKRYVDWDLIIRMSENVKIYSVPILLSNYYYDLTNNRITNDKTHTHDLNLMHENRRNRLKNKHEKLLSENTTLDKGVSIIIPSYESLEEIQKCIDSIFTLKLNKYLEIIVVDNKSNKDVKKYLINLKEENKIKLILNNVNYGFTYAVNQGIDISNNSNDILILNNDATLTPGAINNLQKYAYKLKDCGITVPQQIIEKGNKSIPKHVPYANYKQECDVNISAIHDNIINVPTFHSGEILELDFAPFFCTYIKRDVLNRFISLDAELGRHYRSDRIFSYYMKHIFNLKIYYISEAIVYHKHQSSTNILRANKKEFETMFIKNQWEEELASDLGFKNAIWDF